MHAKWICGLALIAMVAFPSISEGKAKCRRERRPDCHVGTAPCVRRPALRHKAELNANRDADGDGSNVGDRNPSCAGDDLCQRRAQPPGDTMQLTPETTTIMRPHTVMAPVEKTKTITQMVSRRVVTPVTQTYTLCSRMAR